MTFWSDHRGIIYGVRTIRVYELIQDLPGVLSIFLEKTKKINNLFLGYDMLFKCLLINPDFFCYIKYFHFVTVVDAVKFSLRISLMYLGL